MATKVVAIESFEIVTPATVLESRLLAGGPVVSRIEVPESRVSYAPGHVFTFGRKAAAKAFCAAHPGKVRVSE
jgi:hypothetical protein